VGVYRVQKRFPATAHVLGINASLWPEDATFTINNSAHLKVQDDYVVPTVSAVPRYLSTPPAGKVGTILMDFPEYPDNRLIAQIIGLNQRK
jgi:hypothetical protein